MDNYTKVQSLLDDIFVTKGLFIPSLRTVKGEWLNCQCPFHKGGQESHPSFGINFHRGYYKCFACGETGTIEGLAAKFEADIDWQASGARYQAVKINPVVKEDNPDYNYDADIAFLRESVQEYPESLLARGISPETLRDEGVVYNPSNKFIGFQHFCTSNLDLLCVTRRHAEYKMFYMPKGLSLSVYGFQHLSQVRHEPLYVTEGQLDALSLIDMGHLAVALTGLGSAKQFNEIAMCMNREICLAFDNDEAGYKGANKLYRYLAENQRFKQITMLKYPEGCKDPNDILLKEGRNYNLESGRAKDILFEKARLYSNRRQDSKQTSVSDKRRDRVQIL